MASISYYCAADHIWGLLVLTGDAVHHLDVLLFCVAVLVSLDIREVARHPGLTGLVVECHGALMYELLEIQTMQDVICL